MELPIALPVTFNYANWGGEGGWQGFFLPFFFFSLGKHGLPTHRAVIILTVVYMRHKIHTCEEKKAVCTSLGYTYGLIAKINYYLPF